MDTRKFFGKLFGGYLWGNLLAMAVVVILLFLGVKYSLEYYTHHGEAIIVPDVKGKSYVKARQMLSEEELIIVVSDSGYNKSMPSDCVLAQTPAEMCIRDSAHTVYVTVNSPSSPTFAIPDIVDNSSQREAEAKLMAMGFRLLPAQTVTGEKEWVYGIICRGRRVSNGDRIPIDYPLTLLVGNGSIGELDDVEYIDDAYSPPVTDEVDEFEEVTEPPVAE